MSGDTIERVLAGTLADPDGGPPLAVPTRSVVIADSLDGDEREVVAALGLGPRLALVSDPETHEALGARVERALRGAYAVDRIGLGTHPHADDETVAKIRAASTAADALIAVGSGTVNDLCKYAAALDDKPYAVFATAPSMNGYTSVNAAITVGGHKKSLAASAAIGVFLDLEVLAAAPARLIRSGLGDSLCRSTAQADWLLANALRGERYREAPFALLAQDEAALFATSDALLAGDVEAMRSLARTLVLSGFGMTICGGSMPASQGEHLIAHFVEMRAGPDIPASFHGEQIGVATLTTARLQAEILDGEAPVLAECGPRESEVLQRFGPEVGAACWRELEAKRLTGERLDEANRRLAEGWKTLAGRIAGTAIHVSDLEAVLVRAGAPTRAAELGWPGAFYRDAIRHAREIRNRFTFLDLAAQAGRLDAFVERQ